MPGGESKFQKTWLELFDCNNDRIGSWCSQGKRETEAYCSLCKCYLSVANGGISQILPHAKRKKHVKASKLIKGQMTLKSSDTTSNEISISNPPRNLSVAFTIDQTVTRAEALWAMKVAVCDFSFESCKDIVPLFKAMFEGHSVANSMKLGERKISYILSHGLGPYFHSETISDIKQAVKNGGFFTLCFDETTTNQIKKQLDLLIRYWSPKCNKVVCAYITSLFFGHADAELVCKSILNAMKEDGVPINKILMLSMDGPNVNLLIAKKLNEKLSKLGSGKLVDLDTCSLHKVHNCFSKALDELPLNIDEFATDLFSFFKQSAARREDLHNLEILLECEEKFLLRHVNSRWLTLGPVVARILSLYKALEEYFVRFLPKQKSIWGNLQNNSRYKRIAATLKAPETVVYLEFVAALTANLQSYLTLFQTEGPLVHLLYSETSKLIRNVLLKFMKEEYICNNLEGKKLLNINVEAFENYKKISDLDVGIGTKRALSCLKETKANEARMALRSCLIKLAKSLMNSLPLTNSTLKDLEILHPFMREAKNDAIQRLCISLKPLGMNDQDVDRIMMEWQSYRLDCDVSKLCEEFQSKNQQRIDLFWKDVFGLKNSLTGKAKYQYLPALVKNCLILSHGNADVERGFSMNNTILSKNRLSISESTLIGIRNVKDAVKNYGDIFSVPITGKLLDAVTKSYSVYKSEKEAMAKATEEGKKKRKYEEKQEEEEKNKRKKLETEQKIMTMKAKVQFLQKELTAANTCLSENNKKLRESLKLKDYITARVVSTVIETTTTEIERITKELCNIQEELKACNS